MPRGGKRPNAGRKPGKPNASTISAAQEKELQRQELRAYIRSHVPRIVDAQIENACGVSYMMLRNKDGTFSEATNVDQVKAALAAGGNVLVQDEDGTLTWESSFLKGLRPYRFFTRQPHQGSASMLLAYVADKPVEAVEVTGHDAGPIVIKWKD